MGRLDEHRDRTTTTTTGGYWKGGMACARGLHFDPSPRLGYINFTRRELYQLANSVTGFPTAFGVFQEYYSSHPESLKDDTANVAVIGTTITVCSLIFSPRAMVQDLVLEIGWQTEQYPVG
jgi:hypothetical protein